MYPISVTRNQQYFIIHYLLRVPIANLAESSKVLVNFLLVFSVSRFPDCSTGILALAGKRCDLSLPPSCKVTLKVDPLNEKGRMKGSEENHVVNKHTSEHANKEEPPLKKDAKEKGENDKQLLLFQK